MKIYSVLAATLLFAAPLAAQRSSSGDSTSRLDTIRVRAERASAYTLPATPSATRTITRLRDLPQSISVVGRAQLADQAVQSMADVVRYLPGVTMGQGEGHRDQPTMRGISSTADFFVNGVRDDAQYLRDVYNVERVEALKGPSALAFGRGGGGGLLNRVMRAADFAAHRSMSIESGVFNHTRGTIDLGAPLGSRAAGRVTGVSEHSGSFRQNVTLERSGINPTAALVAGGGVLRTAYEHFEDRRVVDRGLPSFAGQPAPLDERTFIGDPLVNRARAVVDHGRLEFERDAGPSAHLRAVAAGSRYDKMYRNLVPGAMSANGATVALSGYQNATERRNAFTQTDLTWEKRSGAIHHRLLTGVDLGRQWTTNYRETGYFGSATTTAVSTTGLSEPVPVSFRQSASDADNAMRADIAAVFVQHQAELGRRWQTLVGIRAEHMSLAFDNRRTGAALHRRDLLALPRAGLVFKPRDAVSLYANVAMSALPSAGDQFSSLTATTATLRPERFVTREVGAKWEPTSRARFTASWYALVRSNSTAPDPTRAGAVVQTGRQESRGVELEVLGDVTAWWQVAGGASWQRARITSRTTSAVAGATVPLVPASQLSLWNRLQRPGLPGLGVGVVHQGAMYAAIDNAVTLPAFTRVDAALFVPLGARLRAQANVENVAGRRYFVSANGNNNLQPGAPRTLRVSITTQ